MCRNLWHLRSAEFPAEDEKRFDHKISQWEKEMLNIILSIFSSLSFLRQLSGEVKITPAGRMYILRAGFNLRRDD